MVYGDKRPNLVGILVPDPEWAAEWAEAEGLPKDMKLLREHEKFRTAIRAAIDRVNGQLSVIEKVRKFDFADEPFGIENEQMTPSMKRSEEHTSELQSLMRISYAVFCLKKKNTRNIIIHNIKYGY